VSNRIDPDYTDDEEVHSISKVFADALALAHRQTYNERNDSWQVWVIGICGLLVVGAVGGGIAMYGKLTALEVTVQDIKYLVEHRQ
jgi:hypothetical protein